VRRAGVVAALLAAGCITSRPKMSSSELYLTERMATVLLSEGNAAEAENAFREALKQDPDNPEMLNGLGLSLLMMSRAREAVPEFDKAIKIAPGKGSYLNNRGAARLETGDTAGAEDDFLKAYESPNSGDKESALINLGRSRYRRGRFEESEESLTRAIALNPTFDALTARGVTREARQNEEGAVSDFLAALRLKPENPSALLRVGLGLVVMQKTDLGHRYLRRICELAPDSVEATRARVLLGEETTFRPH
jgi:Tfp pilus assembly protein PilF